MTLKGIADGFKKQTELFFFCFRDTGSRRLVAMLVEISRHETAFTVSQCWITIKRDIICPNLSGIWVVATLTFFSKVA